MRRLLVALLFLLIFSTGCSLHYTVPDVDVGLTPPTDAEKIPISAAVLVPDESLTLTKAFNMGLTQTYTIPAGKLVLRASREVSPHYFEKAAVVRNAKETAGFDLVLAPAVADFGIEFNITGLSTNHIKARVSLVVVVKDPKGALLWEKTVTSPWTEKVYAGFSAEEVSRHLGMALTEATATAFKDSLRQLAMSLDFQNTLATGAARAETGAPTVLRKPAPQDAAATPQPPPPDSGIAREKLKAALEKGLITADQVSRAMEEVKSPKRSKTLDAFLQGKIDGKQFGELY